MVINRPIKKAGCHRGDFLESWRLTHHIRRDSGQRLDRRWNGLTRIHERTPLLLNPTVTHCDNRHFGNSVPRGVPARRLHVYERERR